MFASHGTARHVTHVYAQETVIAEKLHAMVERGQANSRAKDFFDINFLSQQFPFEGESLTAAIRSTFLRRGRALPIMPIVAWTPAYFEEPTKLLQWAAFLRKTKLPEQTLPEVVARIERFLSLPLMKSITGCRWSAQWQTRRSMERRVNRSGALHAQENRIANGKWLTLKKWIQFLME